MFGRSSDDVLLLPRRIYGRSQNSARMKKTTFFCKSTFWVSTFLPLLSPKLRTHFGVRNQYQAKSAYARFIFEQVKEMFFCVLRAQNGFIRFIFCRVSKKNKSNKSTIIPFPDEFWNLQTSKDHVSLWQKRTPKNTCS